MKKRLFTLLVILALLPTMALAQRNVTGIVVDADNQQPLIGASL